MKTRTVALLSMVAATVFWGLSFISTKVCLPVLPPMSIGALRFAIAVALLFAIKRLRCPDERMELRDVPALVAAGLFGVTGYFFCENNGLKYISASEASIITAAIPVVSLFVELAVGALRKASGAAAGRAPERLGILRWLGALLSVLGVYMVAGVSIAVSGSALGYLFMLGSVACWVAYSFLTRPLFARHSRIFIVFWQSLFGFLAFAPFAIAELPSWGAFTWPIIGHLLYLGILCSAFSYLFYAIALDKLGVGTTNVFINLIPVVTVAAGFFWLSERLSLVQWLGSALVLGGIFLASYQRRQS